MLPALAADRQSQLGECEGGSRSLQGGKKLPLPPPPPAAALLALALSAGRRHNLAGLVPPTPHPTHPHPGQVDKSWSLVPIVYALHFLLHDRVAAAAAHAAPPPLDPRLLLIAALVAVWGLRLTWNFARKGGYRWSAEDYRCVALGVACVCGGGEWLVSHVESSLLWSTHRPPIVGPPAAERPPLPAHPPRCTRARRWPVIRDRLHPLAFLVFNLTFVSLYQHFLLLLIATPAYLAWQNAGRPLHAVDAVAAGLAAFFIAFEAVADQQQWSFQVWWGGAVCVLGG